jgi:dihydrofolate synthase/folylpolyglutamate synthase
MSLTKAEKFLNSFTDYEKTTGYSYSAAYYNLNRMVYLLSLVGNPHLKVPSVHITGTKGKGSTAHFIAAILRGAGLKTGLYTSPHILTFRERIKLNGEMISLKDIGKLIRKIAPAVKILEKKTAYGAPTFFEVYTALAFLYFYEKKAEVVVLEVGMGGRLDATNVVRPLVSVITPISLDHIKELGKTLEKIAKEKSGIIKKGVPVVSAPQSRRVLAIIRQKAKAAGSGVYLEGKDFRHRVTRSCSKGVSFNLYGIGLVFKGLKSVMAGRHQALNASVALAASELAIKTLLNKTNILERVVPAAISKVKLEGRIQIFSKQPLLLLDAAHNTASAKVLFEALKSFKYDKLVMVIGMAVNKDIKGFLKVFAGQSEEMLYVKSSNYRSAEPEELLSCSGDNKGKLFDSVAEGLEYALRSSGKKDLICVTGSFYVLGDALRYLKKRSKA